MTVICIKDGIIAADSAQWYNDLIVSYKKKIVKWDDGFVGCAGDSDIISQFIDCKKQDIDLDDDKDTSFSVLKLTFGGEVYYRSKSPVWRPIGEKIAAIGIAKEFALGLLLGGNSAQQAVQTCIERYAYCGGTVLWETILN